MGGRSSKLPNPDFRTQSGKSVFTQPSPLPSDLRSLKADFPTLRLELGKWEILIENPVVAFTGMRRLASNPSQPLHSRQVLWPLCLDFIICKMGMTKVSISQDCC